MSTLTLDDLEQDQQNLIEKSDIKTLAMHCQELQAHEEEIIRLEEQVKDIKQKADKISSEVIPELLAEQGLSSLKLADGSGVEVKKTYSCTVKKDSMELLSHAEQEGYEPQQKQKVEPMTLKALYRERVEAGLDMPSEFFHTFVKDQTKIGRKS